MRRKPGSRCPRTVLFVLVAALTVTGSGWAEQGIPSARPATAPTDDSPQLAFMAGLAGAIGSLFYIPFKVAAICPGMALASGASLAVTGGDRTTAEHLLRVGCTGTYFITPGMPRGKEEFQGAGER